jgi:hypothetical protein
MSWRPAPARDVHPTCARTSGLELILLRGYSGYSGYSGVIDDSGDDDDKVDEGVRGRATDPQCLTLVN